MFGRRAVGMLGLLVVLWILPAQAARSANGDSVTGGGSAGPLFSAISVDAHSGPAGESPTGTVSFVVFGTTAVGGPITCLFANGPIATIGFDDTAGGSGATQAVVIDNASTGLPDVFGAAPTPNDCTTPAALPLETMLTGDLVVHDAPALPTKGQCKHGGWRTLTNADGEPFRNQGHCVAAAARGLRPR